MHDRYQEFGAIKGDYSAPISQPYTTFRTALNKIFPLPLLSLPTDSARAYNHAQPFVAALKKTLLTLFTLFTLSLLDSAPS